MKIKEFYKLTKKFPTKISDNVIKGKKLIMQPEYRRNFNLTFLFPMYEYVLFFTTRSTLTRLSKFNLTFTRWAK